MGRREGVIPSPHNSVLFLPPLVETNGFKVHETREAGFCERSWETREGYRGPGWGSSCRGVASLRPSFLVPYGYGGLRGLGIREGFLL